MKFSLIIATLFAMTQIPNKTSQESPFNDIASCRKFNDLLKKATNNACDADSFDANSLDLSKKCTKALADLSEKDLVTIALKSKRCEDDIVSNITQDLEDQIIESILSDLNNNDESTTQKPARDKKNSSQTAKENLWGKRKSSQRKDM
jgi:hypothetical protein